MNASTYKIPRKLLGYCAFLYLAISSFVQADTAYQALDRFIAANGRNSLDPVYLIRGEGGVPHPQEWMVYRGKKNARAFQVSGIQAGGTILKGQVPGAHTGLETHAQPINFSMLNVDSNAAHYLAQRQARRENFHFKRIDYELEQNSLAGVPAWTMRLFNEDKSYIGELTISGATGEVLYPLRLYAYRVEILDGQEVFVTVREPWSKRALRSVGRWFSQTGTAYGKDLRHAAGTLEEITVSRRSRPFSEDVK